MHTNIIVINVHTNTVVISVHTNTIVIIVHTLIHINKSSTYEWEDPHLGRDLVFGGRHHIQTSHSKQLSLVVLPFFFFFFFCLNLNARKVY